MSIRSDLLRVRNAAQTLPSTEVSEVLELVRRGPPFDLLFFSELADARWIEILQQNGFYDEMPNLVHKPDGTSYYATSPALFGLARVAEKAPKETAAILQRLRLGDNPAIGDQVMRVVALLKEKRLAEALLPKMRTLIEMPGSFDWIFLDNVFRTWLAADAIEPTFSLLRTWCYANIRSREDRFTPSRDWSITKIDREIVAKLSARYPLRAAALMMDLLTRWAALERNRVATTPNYFAEGYAPLRDPDFDYPPTYSFQSFESRSSLSEDVQQTAARRLYQIAKEMYGSDLEQLGTCDSLLRADGWFLFRRLRWQLYSEFPATTLDFARAEVLERIPNVGENRHPYEFAQMLETHSKLHGFRFLTEDEVEQFNAAVLSGPMVHDEAVSQAEKARFHLIQLQPIATLLRGDRLAAFNQLASTQPPATPSSYGFVGGGEARSIEYIAPPEAEELANKPDGELWDFLNTWQPRRHPDPARWWVEESIGSVTAKFAGLLETHPTRFLPAHHWWTNIRRPEVLSGILDVASERLARRKGADVTDLVPPTEAEWENWFGIADWITVYSSAREHQSEPDTWNWPRMVVVKFLRATLEAIVQPPHNLTPQLGVILARLVKEGDATLLKAAEKPAVGDWLTTAINSVRGTAVEAILELIYKHRRESTENTDSELIDLLIDRLRDVTESPAVFAIFGARLRLALYVLPPRFDEAIGRLLNEGPTELRGAFLRAHVLYDNPASDVVKRLPMFATAATRELSNPATQRDEHRGGRGGYGSSLGVHLGFYYWNATFADQPTADKALDDFFTLSTPNERAETLQQIARIFATPGENSHQGIYDRVMQLWDRRFNAIVIAVASGSAERRQFTTELTAFIDWISCDALDLAWRFDRVKRVLELLDQVPHVFSIFEPLDRLTAAGNYLPESLYLLTQIVTKSSNEASWSYQPEHLRVILMRGLQSDDAATRALASELQDSLLTRGLFDYLDLPDSLGKASPE